MLLLIYNDREDPVVKALQSEAAASAFTEPVTAISLEEILSDAKIFDQIEDGIPHISWTFPKYGTITNSPAVKLINRANMIQDQLFSGFHPEDREYARTEFAAYLTFALNAFPNKLTAPGFFGLAGNQYPMPLQWARVKRLHPELGVPHYYLGRPQQCSFDAARSDIVYSNTYAYRHWRPGPRPDVASLFAFVRPAGEPVFTFVSGPAAFVADSAGGSALTAAQREELCALSVSIAQDFGCAIAELLFFVDKGQLTFGVLDIRPVVTDKAAAFAATLSQGLQDYFAEVAL